ncbi:MAG: c-type cytochrome [Candidatus Rokubacteria bacterium]|nr:c-type cytochrome [Candidatus Rokubacteria bacterium]
MSVRGGFALGVVGGVFLALAVAGGTWFLLLGPQLAPRTAGPGSLGDPGLALSAQERRGEALYVANCVSCHGGPTGGSMMDYPPRHNANGHTWHHPDCGLATVIRDGGDEMTQAMREMMALASDAPTMPAFKDRLSPADIEAVLSYIRLMWTPQQRSVQAQVTREQCAPR